MVRFPDVLYDFNQMCPGLDFHNEDLYGGKLIMVHL